MDLPNRNYPNGDADMLTACATLTESAIAHKAILQTKRSNWADPYFEDLKQRLADISAKHLGADNAKDLRNATLQILSLQKQALNALSEMNVQVSVDYAGDKPRRTELLKQLGFTDHLKAAQKNDQQALVHFLYAFKAAMHPQLKAEMVAKGTLPGSIDQITGYADVLQKANVDQEFNKSGRKGLTADGIIACNDIYNEVMGNRKMASTFLRGQPGVQSAFSYAKVSAAMQGGIRTKKQTANADEA